MKRMLLREARRRAGLTQVELSAKSGVGQTAISKIEVGVVTDPSFETVRRLADALNMDPRALRFGARQPESGAAA